MDHWTTTLNLFYHMMTWIQGRLWAGAWMSLKVLHSLPLLFFLIPVSPLSAPKCIYSNLTTFITFPFEICIAGFTFNEIGSTRASTSKVICCHFSSDGKLLATGGHDKKVLFVLACLLYLFPCDHSISASENPRVWHALQNKKYRVYTHEILALLSHLFCILFKRFLSFLVGAFFCAQCMKKVERKLLISEFWSRRAGYKCDVFCFFGMRIC